MWWDGNVYLYCNSEYWDRLSIIVILNMVGWERLSIIIVILNMVGWEHLSIIVILNMVGLEI